MTRTPVEERMNRRITEMEDLHQRAHKRRRRLVNRDTIVEEALEGAAVCCRVPASLCSSPMLTACTVPFRACVEAEVGETAVLFCIRDFLRTPAFSKDVLNAQKRRRRLLRW